MRTAYKCRAYPDPDQASVLNRTFGCVRVVWNRTLAWRRQRYQADKTGTNYAQASGYLTTLKATDEFMWLNEVSCVPLQQAIRHQQAAYARVLRQAGPVPAVEFPGRAAVRGVHPVRVPVARRRAVPGENEYAAGVHLVLARHRPRDD